MGTLISYLGWQVIPIQWPSIYNITLEGWGESENKYKRYGFKHIQRIQQQHITTYCILLRTIRAYWSKRRVVPPVLFRTNYYSIEILHGVTAIILIYHPHHAKLQVLPFSWGRSELTDRNVELYPQFFLELITTQLRFYMVSPQLSLLIILTMQSYKFYHSPEDDQSLLIETSSCTPSSF